MLLLGHWLADGMLYTADCLFAGTDVTNLGEYTDVIGSVTCSWP